MTAGPVALQASSRARLGQWLLAAIALGAVAYAAYGLDLRAVVERVAAARVLPLLAALGVGATIPALVALQWWIFLPPGARPGYWRICRYAVLAIAAWSVLPSVAGVAVAAAVLATSGIGAASSATVLALDQLGVGVAKSVLFVSTALLVPVAGIGAHHAPALAGVVVTAVLVLVVAGVTVVRRSVGARWQRWRAWLVSLPSPRRLVAGIAIGCGVKCVEGVVMVCVDAGLRLTPSLSRTLLTLCGASLSTIIGVAPANLGLYEGSVFAAYRLSGVGPESAAGAALLQHAANLTPPLALAALALLVRWWRRD